MLEKYLQGEKKLTLLHLEPKRSSDPSHVSLQSKQGKADTKMVAQREFY